MHMVTVQIEDGPFMSVYEEEISFMLLTMS